MVKDYLFRKNLTVKKFAADLEISTSYLYQLLRGERKPSLQLAHKIEKYTSGEISVKDLLSEILQRKYVPSRELDLQKELENQEKRLEDLETSDKELRLSFEMIEERLLKLEKERKR
jgi:transcriptional regulator with XRE-family HTH domain